MVEGHWDLQKPQPGYFQHSMVQLLLAAAAWRKIMGEVAGVTACGI